MVNVALHRNSLFTILRAIYADPLLRGVIGFKGGTAAMIFYDLPRFSVDLDFDLLDERKKEAVFERLAGILPLFATVVEAVDKKNTLFFLLRYKEGERVLKIEVSKRGGPVYEVKQYLGVTLLVMKQEDMAASKLAAILTRHKFASRDVFDLWFFLKNNWQINGVRVREQTGLSLPQALEKAQQHVSRIKQTELLAGLGELVNSKQKAFVKEKLQDDLLFLLRLYISNLKRFRE